MGRYLGDFGLVKHWRCKPRIDWPFAHMKPGDWFRVPVRDRSRDKVQTSMYQEAKKLDKGGWFRADQEDGSGFTTVRCFDACKEREARHKRSVRMAVELTAKRAAKATKREARALLD